MPDDRRRVFDLVREARDVAVDLIVSRYQAQQSVAGFEVDRAARQVIDSAGYGDGIRHRTGHSITDEVHGTGANLDDLETHDDRALVRRTCFSVEPGVYLKEFGVRLEINILIPSTGPPAVSGEQQTRPVAILAEHEGS